MRGGQNVSCKETHLPCPIQRSNRTRNVKSTPYIKRYDVGEKGGLTSYLTLSRFQSALHFIKTELKHTGTLQVS